MNYDYDLTIIGGGPGGYVAAIRACQLGLKVALVEKNEMGGTCLNRGCIPTKSLLHSAEIYQMAKTAEHFGIECSKVTFDYKKIVGKKESVVNELRSGVEYLIKKNGCTILNGTAVVKNSNTIEVKGNDVKVIKTGKLIIATGSRPVKPPIQGIDNSRVLDSDDVLALTCCPDRIVIIGGGVIGVEFATIFSSLGKEVTIIEMMEEILPGIDREISSMLRILLEKKGIKIYTSSKVVSINSNTKEIICTFKEGNTEKKAEGDIVVVSIGRKPNTESIGLENLGIEMEKGYIKTNDGLETSVEGVYAIGDVTGKGMLAHTASAQALVAAANAAGANRKMDYSVIPACIYTNPEIAVVGLSEEQALKKGYRIKTGKFPVSANGKSVIMGEHEGIAKIISDEETGEIIGAHIMGPRATDMISEMCVAMKLESTIEEVGDTIHPHPTISEILLEAAHDVEGCCIHKP